MILCVISIRHHTASPLWMQIRASMCKWSYKWEISCGGCGDALFHVKYKLFAAAMFVKSRNMMLPQVHSIGHAHQFWIPRLMTARTKSVSLFRLFTWNIEIHDVDWYCLMALLASGKAWCRLGWCESAWCCKGQQSGKLTMFHVKHWKIKNEGYLHEISCCVRTFILHSLDTHRCWNNSNVSRETLRKLGSAPLPYWT